VPTQVRQRGSSTVLWFGLCLSVTALALFGFYEPEGSRPAGLTFAAATIQSR
jgi:multisubunit Na+/H+ antiporter MnhB subunit